MVKATSRTSGNIIIPNHLKYIGIGMDGDPVLNVRKINSSFSCPGVELSPHSVRLLTGEEIERISRLKGEKLIDYLERITHGKR